MSYRLAGIGGLAALFSLLQAPDPYAGLPDPTAVRVLQAISGRPQQANVPPQDGRYLYDLVVKSDLKAGLEIGSSFGCSGIWLGLAFRQTGGRLVTVESDRRRAREAAANFRRAGLSRHVEPMLAEALEVVPGMGGPFDLVFIDGRKQDYGLYLAIVLPKVRPGGFIAAHNVSDSRSRMGDFIRSLTSNPQLKTEFVALSGSGLSISRVVRK